MIHPQQLEEAYRAYTSKLTDYIHDGVIDVDLKFLHQANLLHTLQENQSDPDDLSQYFHVIESPEKVTLFNDQFVVWIVPKMEQSNPATQVLIALNQGDKPHLELAFLTSGVYNTPKNVLKILQHFITDMVETEQTLLSMEKNG
jgi:Tfp pilus assembly protein PilZ